MGNGKNWSVEDIAYLEDKWGVISIPGISRYLNRSINAVKLKAERLKLGMHLHSSENITLNQLAIAMGRSYTIIRHTWIPKNLPFKLSKSVNKKYKVISIPDFWEWAYKNKTIINFAKVEVNILGEEPEWVEEQRVADIKALKYKKTPWTSKEDVRLINYLKSYKYGYEELTVMLNRTAGAIQRRCNDLKISARPLRADNHNKWTDVEVKKLIDLKSKGYQSDVISEYISGRSGRAIQGKLDRMGLIYNKKAGEVIV